jgi:hypothetical protein
MRQPDDKDASRSADGDAAEPAEPAEPAGPPPAGPELPDERTVRTAEYQAAKIAIRHTPKQTWAALAGLVAALVGLLVGMAQCAASGSTTASTPASATPIPSPTPTSGPASVPSVATTSAAPTSIGPSVSLAEWSTQVEAACRRMVPTFEGDVAAMKKIGPSGLAYGNVATVAEVLAALRPLYDHLTTLGAAIQQADPPSHPVALQGKWLELFTDRVEELQKAIDGLERNTFLSRTQAGFSLTAYGSLTDRALSAAAQLDITSCP